MESGGVELFLGVPFRFERGRKYSFGKTLFFACLVLTLSFLVQQFSLTGFASARNYSSCIANAKAKFEVNTNSNGEKKPYSDITKVGSGSGEYGVEWACSGGDAGRAVVWLADDYTTGWPNVINVNTVLDRTGKKSMYIVGSVVGQKRSKVDGSWYRINYATQVRL